MPPPPSRGAQFPIDDVFKPPSKDYVPPPPRDAVNTSNGGRTSSAALAAGSVINSHKEPPRDGLTDAYIPPKTKNDVPKNFLRPEDLPAPPSPEEIDILEDDEDLLAAIEGLEEDGAFLGLAKLKDGRKKEGEEEDSKKAK